MRLKAVCATKALLRAWLAKCRAARAFVACSACGKSFCSRCLCEQRAALGGGATVLSEMGEHPSLLDTKIQEQLALEARHSLAVCHILQHIKHFVCVCLCKENRPCSALRPPSALHPIPIWLPSATIAQRSSIYFPTHGQRRARRPRQDPRRHARRAAQLGGQRRSRVRWLAVWCVFFGGCSVRGTPKQARDIFTHTHTHTRLGSLASFAGGVQLTVRTQMHDDAGERVAAAARRGGVGGA